MTAVAILLAAGRGERLGAGGPKALVRVGGRPLIAYAVDAVERCDRISGFVLVAPPGFEDELSAEVRSAKLREVVAGGVERQDSVAVALRSLPAAVDRVACHDVARPFALPELFSAVLAALDGEDPPAGAVPVVGVPDTLKRVRGGAVEETLDRREVLAAQTPQAFLRRPLEEAHRRAAADGIRATDDAALLERLGLRVVAVTGDPDNFKVTVPSDLRRAEALALVRG